MIVWKTRHRHVFYDTTTKTFGIKYWTPEIQIYKTGYRQPDHASRDLVRIVRAKIKEIDNGKNELV